jgi:hypothetical protein
MNAKQKKTLAMVFEKPTRSDVRYEDVKGSSSLPGQPVGMGKVLVSGLK